MAINFQRMTSILPSLCKLMRGLLLHRPWGMEEDPYTLVYINKLGNSAIPTTPCLKYQATILFRVVILEA